MNERKRMKEVAMKRTTYIGLLGIAALVVVAILLATRDWEEATASHRYWRSYWKFTCFYF